MTGSGKEGPLHGVRALDLTDEKGWLCARVLGDLGADVIKIEPPGGDPGRRLGPFFHDQPHPERSLPWLAYNYNKRGVTLDLNCADGKALFHKMVKGVDVVVESYPPGTMEKLGLGYDQLRQWNRRLVLTSITPFGQTGPSRDLEAPDLVLWAMGGVLALAGDEERGPVRISLPQAYLYGSADGAVGTLMALYHRESSGEGQHVDVSAQAALQRIVGPTRVAAHLLGQRVRRGGTYRPVLAAAKQRVRLNQVWQCQDGHVTYMMWGGLVGAKSHQALVTWMDSKGMADEFLKGIDWAEFDMAKMDQATVDRIEKQVGNFFRTNTKKELYEEAVKRRVMLYPVSIPPDLLNYKQLQQRNYWVEVAHPEIPASLLYPGYSAKLSATPMGIGRPAPRLGEHNREIYLAELGLTEKELVALAGSGVI